MEPVSDLTQFCAVPEEDLQGWFSCILSLSTPNRIIEWQPSHIQLPEGADSRPVQTQGLCWMRSSEVHNANQKLQPYKGSEFLPCDSDPFGI